MQLQVSAVIAICFISLAAAKIDPRNLRCLVCRTTFEELNKAVMAIDRRKLVDVGNFRMDASGNTMQQRVPAHRSDVYISEMIEDICKKLNDYVRVYYKSSGKLAIMQLTTESGMNPEFSKTTFVTDDDLNKSLEYYCERIFEENEEETLAVYKNRPQDEVMPDAEQEICFKHAKYCDSWMLPDETDTTWTSEMEREYVKIHGPDPYGFGMQMPPPEQEELEELDGEPAPYDEEEERRRAEQMGLDGRDEL